MDGSAFICDEVIDEDADSDADEDTKAKSIDF